MDRLASIPVRVSVVRLHTIRGHKPPRTAKEISIPIRVLGVNGILTLSPSSYHDTG
jgi:hypothetical protein